MTTTVILHCDHCGANLRLASGRLRPGATASCPKCRQLVRMPETAPEPSVEEIQCQICGALLRMRADRRPVAGGTAKCPRCRSTVTIPPPEPPLGAAAPSDGGAVTTSGDDVMPAGVSPQPAPAPDPTPAPAGEAGANLFPGEFPGTAPAPPVPPQDFPAEPGMEGFSPPPSIDPAPAESTPPATPAFQDTAPPDSAPDPPISAPAPDPEPAPAEEPESPAAPMPAAIPEEPAIEILGDESGEDSSSPALESGPHEAPPPRQRYHGVEPPTFWTVEIGDETLRPGGVATLRHWARQGKLRPDDRVRRGDGPWQLAREVPELASILARSGTGKTTSGRARKPMSRDARDGMLSGLAGGAVALVPVLALLVLSQEFERLSARWSLSLGNGVALLTSAVLLTGFLIGRTLAFMQTSYERHGEATNMWSWSGASAIGSGFGLALGIPALAFWPHTSAFTLLLGFGVYGLGVGILSLVCYRSIFQDRKT